MPETISLIRACQVKLNEDIADKKQQMRDSIAFSTDPQFALLKDRLNALIKAKRHINDAIAQLEDYDA